MKKPDNITFYNTYGKTYKPAVISWPSALENEMEVSQIQENLGIIVDSSVETAVKNPVLYVCRNKGIIRLNRYEFANVEIPTTLTAKLRHTTTLELTLVRSSHSLETFCTKVEHILRFPEYMTKSANGGDGGSPNPDPDIDDREKHTKRQKDSSDDDPDMLSIAHDLGDLLDFNIDDEDEDEDEDCNNEKEHSSTRPRTSPRQLFEDWIRKNGGTILEESRDSGCVLAYDGRKPILVSFFDQEDPDWLADEEQFSNDDPPFWFSISSHVESPVFRLFHAANCLGKTDSCKVTPLMIMSDHINIINAEDMAETWNGMNVNLCYCSRSESFADTFEHLLDRSSDKVDPADLEKLRQAFHAYLLQNSKKNS